MAREKLGNMRKTTKLGAALAVIGALALSACGGSSALMDSSTGTRTKNAALDAEQGLSVKVFRMNLAGVDLSGYDGVGTGIEKDVKPEVGKNEPCDAKRTTVPNIDMPSLSEIFDVCGKDQLMVRYKGFITVPGNKGEKVTVKFTAMKDDGFTLKIGGKSVIDQWNISSCQEREGTIDLVAGKKYPIQAWYFNFAYGGCAQLQWNVGSGEKEIVPASAFTPAGEDDDDSDDDSNDEGDNEGDDESSVNKVAQDGLVGFWSFDDEENFATSDKGAKLTPANGAAYTKTGKSDGGLALNGTNQSLDGATGTVAGLPVGTSNYTISSWFNASALGVRGMVGWGQWGAGNKTNALRIYGNAGGFRHYWWHNDLDSNVKLETGTWYHIVASFDGTTRKLYLNGKELVKNTPSAAAHAVTDVNFSIGRTNNREYFSGILDEVGIWNRALTDEEIAALADVEGSAGASSASSSTTSTTAAPTSTSSSTTSTTAVVASSSSTMAPASSSSEAPVKVTTYRTDEENTMLVEGDETYNVAHNKTFKAPKGKKFGKVLWASYGTPTVNNKELTLSNCHSTKSIDVVQAAAAGKTSFVLPAGNGNYGDPCYGTYKRVKALITLVDDPDYDPANDPNPGVQTDAPNTMFIETAEHFPKDVVAPEGKMFGKVLFASYGIQKLEGNKVYYDWCNSKTSMSVVEDALVGKTSGRVLADNGDYGDPCYGTYKYVKVVVTLVDDPNYKKPESPTTTAAPKVIAAPTNVKATAGTGSADITWDASEEGNVEVTSYFVQYSTDNFETSTIINSTSLEAVALGLENGAEYQIRVAGVNKAEGITSDWSAVVKVTPVAPVTSTTTTTIAESAAKTQTVTPVITPTDKSVTIAADTNTIDCDKACFDAIVASLGATADSAVFVSVDGGERIQLNGSEFTKIPVGSAGKKLTFMSVVDDVVQQVSVPVKRTGEAAPAATTDSGSGDSSSNMVWWLLLLIVIILGGGGYAVSKKRGNNEEA